MARLRFWSPSLLSCAGLVVIPSASHVILGSSFAVPQLAPPLAQSVSGLCLWARRFQQFSLLGRHSLHPLTSRLFKNSGGLKFLGVPNPPLKSDPACIAFRSLSTSRYPGSARRLGAGVAA